MTTLYEKITSLLTLWLDEISKWSETILPALLIIVAGFFISSWAEKAFSGVWRKFKWPESLLRSFFASLVRWGILLFSFVNAIELMGIKNTSILTVLGAAGLAVGLALQGTLSNLSAGVMLLVFRPFHVGDYIETAQLNGQISSISLYHTELITNEHIRVVAPNSMIWAGYLKNMSHFSLRCLILPLSLPYSVDLAALIEEVKALIKQDGRVSQSHPSQILIKKFSEKVMDIEIHLWCLSKEAPYIQSDLMLKIWKDFLNPKLDLLK